jgi:HD-GYP domain-containing protein (c-di-GMP phosphodiesterase class II)
MGAVEVPTEADSPVSILAESDRRLYREKAARGSTRSVVISQALDMSARNDWTRDLALHVGSRLGMAEDQLEALGLAAALQDIGKFGLPGDLLNCDRPLEGHEREFLRRYVEIGERLLDSVPALRTTALIVRASEERWDGAGYPDGIAGPDIPLPARIISACSAYRAMRATRPYGPTLTPTEAAAELARQAGKQFDPAVVDALLGELHHNPRVSPGHQPDVSLQQVTTPRQSTGDSNPLTPGASITGAP